jgi:hypothetical protein
VGCAGSDCWRRGDAEAGEIAQAEKVTRSFVNRLLRLTLPAFRNLSAITKKGSASSYDTGGFESGVCRG